MEKLNLETIELVSTIKKAPKNGPSSSQDFNDGETEKLTDLATIVDRINDVIQPILNGLPETAATGLEGKTLYSDTGDPDQIFFDSQTSTPLTVADSLRLLKAMLLEAKGQLNDVGVEVEQLASKLSSTSQDDIGLALWNLSDSLNQVVNTQRSQSTSVDSLRADLAKLQMSRTQSIEIAPGAMESVNIVWPIAYGDELYGVSLALEDNSGDLAIQNFSRLDGGTGIAVRVRNNSPVTPHIGIVHATAKHD